MSVPEEDRRPRYVDVTIVEFAAHTAYLDPLTGVGYLVAPRPETDVDALIDPLVEAAWSERLEGAGGLKPLSLHAADRERALSHLSELRWALLYNEDGNVETAGRTTDGREALCIYGDPETPDPSLDAIDCAVIALDIAADLDL
ncbi:hypothetical protein [Kribbella sp. NPDC048928]|uniref:hypothetical protein n=1 Tax=Kribbella sp. NPDC048928 TaxID=3364111 RepID=UPI00371ED633